MAFTLSAFKAYGVEAEEAVNKRYIQRAIFTIAAANTDTALDIGTYAGTFWTAVSGTDPGTTALKAIKDINIRASSFLRVAGSSIAGKSQEGVSYKVYSSAASAGGAATEAVTVTGLLAADQILAVSQRVKGANSTALNGYNTQILNGLTLSWTANPGAGSIADILVSRSAATVAGTYSLAMDGTNVQLPDITFVSGDAPTAYVLVLEWTLKDSEEPVSVAA